MKTAISKGFSGLALLLVAAAVPAQQSTTTNPQVRAIEYPPVYRVEVIVFRNVDGRSDSARSAAPVDFSGRIDPLLIARAKGMSERWLADLADFLPVAAIPGDSDESTPYLQAEEQTLRPIPPAFSALGNYSRPIQRAFDRLIDAPEYDPVTVRAWIQTAPRGQAAASVRIHDQNVIDVIGPHEDQSVVPAAGGLPFGPAAATPSPALEVYRVDGTVGLRRRQFLHLDLDLVWQTPRGRVLADRARPPRASPPAADGPDGGFELHRLQQSRIIQPGRLEYFDSSMFGVLARIERFEQVVPEIKAPEPAATIDPVTDSNL